MGKADYKSEDFELGADETLESIRDTVAALDDRLTKLKEALRDDNAALRIDVGQSRRELVYMRSAMQRLQARFDNQLTVLVLANIASGIGVAAVVLAASQGF